MAESISTGFCRLPFLQHFFKKNSNSTQIIFRCLEKTLLIVSCLLITVVATAQKDTLKSPKPSDTLKNDFVTSVQTVGAVEAHKSVEQFKAGRIAIRQDHVLEEIKKTTQKAKDFLKRIIDTSGLNKDLAYTDSIYAIAGDGILGVQRRHIEILQPQKFYYNNYLIKQMSAKKCWIYFKKDFRVFVIKLIHFPVTVRYIPSLKTL